MSIDQLTARITSVNTATAGLGELTSALHDLSRIDGWVSITKADITRRLTELEANSDGPPAADVLARSEHTSAREAAKNERRAHTYGNVPELGRLDIPTNFVPSERTAKQRWQTHGPLP